MVAPTICFIISEKLRGDILDELDILEDRGERLAGATLDLKAGRSGRRWFVLLRVLVLLVLDAGAGRALRRLSRLNCSRLYSCLHWSRLEWRTRS